MDLQKLIENTIAAVKAGATGGEQPQVVDIEFDVPVTGGDSQVEVDQRLQPASLRLKFKIRVRVEDSRSSTTGPFSSIA